MMRLTLPALHHAAVLLEDPFVEQSEPTRREGVEKKLREYFTCLPSAADLPLRHRLLGQYHLARAWKELPVPHLRRSPRMGDFASLSTMKPADVPAGIRGDARVVMRELAMACHHLERAVARRHDDPLAYLALAAALDARAAAIGEPADPEVSERVAEAFRSTTGPELADRGWWVQLKDHRWLWPREPGRLAELAHGIDT